MKIIAESNKQGIKIITSLVEEKKEDEGFRAEGYNDIHYIEKYDVSKSHEMEKGTYIVNQSNLFNEYKEFIINYGKQPCDLEKEGKIVQISFPVFNLPSEMKHPFPQVFIKCDAN